MRSDDLGDFQQGGVAIRGSGSLTSFSHLLRSLHAGPGSRLIQIEPTALPTGLDGTAPALRNLNWLSNRRSPVGPLSVLRRARAFCTLSVPHASPGSVCMLLILQMLTRFLDFLARWPSDCQLIADGFSQYRAALFSCLCLD